MFSEFKTISTLEEVRSFAKWLFFAEAVSFHPDDDFKDYVKAGTTEPAFTAIRAERLNLRMSECFEVCDRYNADIYAVMNVASAYFENLASGLNSEEAKLAVYFGSDSF